MADPKKRLPTNVSGEFFVDSTCINCDTCRQLAPETFDDSGDYSYVYAQPQPGQQSRAAMQALLSCPTGSIGTEHRNNAREVMQDFPLPIEEDVFYCGFNSPRSYGGNSYFVKHPEGNWLIDSPKYLPPVIQALEALGGVKYIFLTHQDDVAETKRYAEHFGSQRIIHQYDLSAQPLAEVVIEGDQPLQFSADFLVIPTPGHTRGHCVLLYKGRFLFSGDHLWWSRTRNHLSAGKGVCWYSWTEQTRSMAALENYDFEWVLPGHGQRIKLSRWDCKKEIGQLVDWMRSIA